MIVTVLNYHSSVITIMVKNDNVLCINWTIKTGTERAETVEKTETEDAPETEAPAEAEGETKTEEDE